MSYNVPDDSLKDMVLQELHELFLKNGHSPSNYNFPPLTGSTSSAFENRLVGEELSYNVPKLLVESPRLYERLNNDQHTAYHRIVDNVTIGPPALYFVCGYGGTGKTFLWTSITAYLRSQHLVVLTFHLPASHPCFFQVVEQHIHNLKYRLT